MTPIELQITDFRLQLGRLLAAKRKSIKLTQIQAAELADISTPTITRIEKGLGVHLESIASYVQIFDLTLSEAIAQASKLCD